MTETNAPSGTSIKRAVFSERVFGACRRDPLARAGRGISGAMVGWKSRCKPLKSLKTAMEICRRRGGFEFWKAGARVRLSVESMRTAR
jgi:hypothetical protein